MNKVISIHLHGVAFQLEEGGFDALRAYLDQAERQLAANPDKAEILADIEQAIGDKFRALLNASRNVVLTAEVAAVIAEMGPVTDGPPTSAESKPESQPGADTTSCATGAGGAAVPKRLYRIAEGAVLTGTCNGLAAYLGIDVTFVRLAVVALTFFSFGTVAGVYFIAAFIIPEAKTPEEKAAAAGPSPTAQEFIRKGREGYYDGLKAFANHEARRAWKRKFRQEMRQQKRAFRWRAAATCAAPNPSFPPPPGPLSSDFYVGMPVLSLIKALLVFVAVFAVFSLFATRTVFGLPLPVGIPLWAGVILLILAYKVVVAPIKALQHAYYFRCIGQPYLWSPFAGLWHGLLSLLVIACAIWLADRFVPGFHEALLNLPAFLRHAADAVQQWWNGANLEKT